jgi:hypothetical protein
MTADRDQWRIIDGFYPGGYRPESYPSAEAAEHARRRKYGIRATAHPVERGPTATELHERAHARRASQPVNRKEEQ